MQSQAESAEKVVLLVEDEPMLRASMARGLGRLRDVSIVQAGSVGEALRALESIEPDLLLSDLDLPDGSGIEIASYLDKKRARVPVVFVSAYVGKFRPLLERRSDVEIHEKPLPIEELRRIVERNLESDVAGAAPFSVADYVQLAAMGRHSAVLSVRSPTVNGQIVIERGQTRHASDERGGGMAAFRRMAFAKGATVHCRALARGETFERNMEGSCESVLLEAARIADEASKAGDDELESDLAWDFPPDPDSDSESDSDSAEAEPSCEIRGSFASTRLFEQLYDEGIEALLAKDYARAFAAFRAASEIEPSDRRVKANLARLREMGHGT